MSEPKFQLLRLIGSAVRLRYTGVKHDELGHIWEVMGTSKKGAKHGCVPGGDERFVGIRDNAVIMRGVSAGSIRIVHCEDVVCQVQLVKEVQPA